MTGIQAINKSMAVFKKANKGDIRTVELWEGTGSGDKWKDLRIHIGYSIDGDYSESEAHPFIVGVYEKDGKIYAEQI